MRIPPAVSVKAKSVARQSARGARLAAASLRGDADGFPARLAGVERDSGSTGSQVAALRRDVDGLRADLARMSAHLRVLTADVARSRMAEIQSGTGSVADAEPAEFGRYATPVASDFTQPRFLELCRLMAHPPMFHRKLWEWVFILHHLLEEGAVRAGARGVGFGVGTEPLPAVFAASGVDIVATDYPEPGAWTAGNQHSGSVEQLFKPQITPDEMVRRHVSHRPCDMNALDPELTGFDFAWSACAFEHLGSIEQGLDFVVNAMQTLKPGGIAVHTTEFNVQSDTDTIDAGNTVLYRLSDLRRLVGRLEADGHEVAPLVIGPATTALDLHVDTAPYTPIHLRIDVAGYATTSVGLVIRRKR